MDLAELEAFLVELRAAANARPHYTDRPVIIIYPGGLKNLNLNQITDEVTDHDLRMVDLVDQYNLMSYGTGWYGGSPGCQGWDTTMHSPLTGHTCSRPMDIASTIQIFPALRRSRRAALQDRHGDRLLRQMPSTGTIVGVYSAEYDRIADQITLGRRAGSAILLRGSRSRSRSRPGASVAERSAVESTSVFPPCLLLADHRAAALTLSTDACVRRETHPT